MNCQLLLNTLAVLIYIELISELDAPMAGNAHEALALNTDKLLQKMILYSKMVFFIPKFDFYYCSSKLRYVVIYKRDICEEVNYFEKLNKMQVAEPQLIL